MNRILWLLVFSVGFLLALPEFAAAGSPIEGAKAGAMGGAFAGVADDPSAMAHNPAGLTGLRGTNAYSGVSVVLISTEYEDRSGKTEHTKSPPFFPPHLYVTTDAIGHNVAFGVGVYSPYGIGGTKWSRNGPTRYVSTESIIGTANVNPTLAWKPLPYLSLGVGLIYMYAWDIEQKMVDQSALGARDGKLDFDGDGDGWGYDAGILLFPESKLSIGLTYYSRVEVDLSGDTTLKRIAPALQPIFGGSTFKTHTQTTVEFPESVSLGFGYRPTDALTIALDFEWVRWSVFDKATYDFEKEIPEAGFTDVTSDLDWRDAWRIKLGVDYRINERFSARCGYSYLEGQVPERSISPSFPATDNHNLSVGLGYKTGPWVIDAYYLAEIFEDLTVENNILSGSYESLHHFFGFSFGYRF